MPKRTDIQRILIFGSGPIVIGQACEFDYSGTQAVRALKEEGYEVILLNSNPATIMTDPELADRTYVEPLQPYFAEQVIAAERPDAILPTLGGQTALNLAVDLHESGVLEKYGVELIGAKIEAIQKAEGRQRFKNEMARLGLDVPLSDLAHTMDEALALVDRIGFPAIIRPAYTLGGTGGGIAYNLEEYREVIRHGLDASPINEVLVEESVIGWKEYELEVMRDLADQVVIICAIENLDAMGVHTGDSITVAPAQTLTDKEYQVMRNAALDIIREIGVETGGSNIQFAVNPDDGRMCVIEMNPRVSRSSALASKATGFPIAKIAAKLAVGYTLDELPNDITKQTPACFEPSIDYVVTKFPRFTFEKFPAADDALTTSMKSIGEVMAIGRSLQESLQKAIRSLEIDRYGFESLYGWDREAAPTATDTEREELTSLIREPNSRRLWAIGDGFRLGWTVADLAKLTGIDPWFLVHIQQLILAERQWCDLGAQLQGQPESATDELQALLQQLKRRGFSDRRLATLWQVPDARIEQLRRELRVLPAWKSVDTCGGEFAAETPYIYSTYGDFPEVERLPGRKVAILGGGPNRIGQGIEFDYCCVHACMALQEAGVQAIMVNCNPETVSTDYDISDRLYFEPLTEEDTASLLELEGVEGVILQFGGQTPLKLAKALERRNIPVLGTSPDAIDAAEDRDRFLQLVDELQLKQPRNGIARSFDEAKAVAGEIGFPIVVRPSYVLGGRAMEIVYDQTSLERYMEEAVRVSPEHPILIDQFLERAVEYDVDAVADGRDVWVAGIMQHIESAGVHSGDSGCSLPPFATDAAIRDQLAEQTRALARRLGVVGLINVQFAVRDEQVYLIEVNPRASRTAPFVSKATGVPLAKLATKMMLGDRLANHTLPAQGMLPYVSVKESVFPFHRFPHVDTLLGPEMKSTGEVMGIDREFPAAFAKATLAAGTALPQSGTAFLSVADVDKPYIVPAARKLAELGFQLVCTGGTQAFLARHGVDSERIYKVVEGRPNIVDAIRSKQIHVVFNTPSGAEATHDSYAIRRGALEYNIPYFTSVEASVAAVDAIAATIARALTVQPLQQWHAMQRDRSAS